LQVLRKQKWSSTSLVYLSRNCRQFKYYGVQR